MLAPLQLARHILRRDPLFRHQHQHMVGQVGDLRHQADVLLLEGGDHHLGGILPNFLGNALQAAVKKGVGVRAGFGVGFAVEDDLI